MTALQAGFSSRRETNPPDKWRLCTLAGRTRLVNQWNHLPPEVKITIITVARNVLASPA